jgi:hypothetical protein
MREIEHGTFIPMYLGRVFDENVRLNEEIEELSADMARAEAEVTRRDVAIQAALAQMHREREALKIQGVQSGGDAMNDILVYGYDKCIELVEAASHSSTI